MRKIVVIFLIFLISISLMALAANRRSSIRGDGFLAGVFDFFQWFFNQKPPSSSAYNVGYSTVSFVPPVGSGGQSKINMAVWYPTKNDAASYEYQGLVKITGKIALNGLAADGKFPLVVFSHGLMGCALQSVGLMQYIASKGYIVLAPDHKDALACSLNKTAVRRPPNVDVERDPFVLYKERPIDIKNVIDKALAMNKEASSMFYQKIDENKIAVSGHSLGGWTAQVAAGAAPDGYERFVDNRVKAVLLFAPQTSQINENDFKKMQKPIIYELGEKDQFNLLSSDVARRVGYDNAVSPKFLVIVKSANHLSFTDTACLFFGSVEKCQTNNPIVKTTLNYASDFLNRYLKGDVSLEAALTTKDIMLSNYEYLK